jgi:hypothetical protein
MGNAAMLSGWRQFALLTATLAAMLLTAKLFSKSEAKQEHQTKPDAPPALGAEGQAAPPVVQIKRARAASVAGSAE